MFCIIFQLEPEPVWFVTLVKNHDRAERYDRPLITIFANSFIFSSSLFFLEGRERGIRMTKVVVKSNAFLLDQNHPQNPSPQYENAVLFDNIYIEDTVLHSYLQ